MKIELKNEFNVKFLIKVSVQNGNHYANTMGDRVIESENDKSKKSN